LKHRSLATSLVRVALSLLALAILFQQVGGQQVWQTLQRADLRQLGAAWLLFLVGIVIRVFRWRVLLLGLGERPPFWLLLKLYLVGGFFNAFLPTGFGGDVVRVLELGHGGSGRSAALGTVLVDRLTGILSLMGIGLIVVPFARELSPWLRWAFVVMAGGGLAAGGLLLDGRILRRLTAWLPESISLTGDGKLASVYAAVTGSGPKAVAGALVLSTVFNLLNVVVYWLCACAVGIKLPLAFYFVVVPLLSLSLLLPISVGGLGARDWVAQLLLAPTAVAQPTTAAWTLLVWAVTAAAGLIGGILYLFEGLSSLLRSSD